MSAPVFMSGTSGSGIGVEIGGSHIKTERALLMNHVTAAGAGLKDRAFDLDRMAERWDDPVRVEGDVFVALEALKAAWRDVAKIAGAAGAHGHSGAEASATQLSTAPAECPQARRASASKRTRNVSSAKRQRDGRSLRGDGVDEDFHEWDTNETLSPSKLTSH